jgi:small-conductance mechanosensitive channel
MQIIEEIYRPHPKTADLEVTFNKFDPSSLNIQVVHWWNSTEWRDYAANFQKLNLELKRRFDAEGVAFALPRQTVYVRQDSQWQLSNGLGGDAAAETGRG